MLKLQTYWYCVTMFICINPRWLPNSLLSLISATSSYFRVITSVWLEVYYTKVHIKYYQTLFKDNLLFQSPVAREK